MRGSDIAAGELTRRASSAPCVRLHSHPGQLGAVLFGSAIAHEPGIVAPSVLHPGQVLDWDGSPKAGFHRCVRQDPDGTSGDKVAARRRGGSGMPGPRTRSPGKVATQPEKTNDLPSRTAPRGVRCIGLDPGSSSSSCQVGHLLSLGASLRHQGLE